MKRILFVLGIMIPITGYCSEPNDSKMGIMSEMVKSGANPVAARCAVFGDDNLPFDSCNLAAKTPNNPSIDPNVVNQLIQQNQQLIDILKNNGMVH